MTKNIILIGGAPTTGKSTMAQKVSEHLGLPWISTDQIREIMREVASRDALPKLFTPEGYDVERFLTEFSVEEIVSMEIEQGEAVWSGVKKLINDDYTWTEGFIVEGVNILPQLVAQDYKDSEYIKTIFLVDEDVGRIRDVVFNRGLADDADKYSDDVKEKEVEWVLLFSQMLKTEAGKHNYKCVEVKKQEEDLQAVLSALNL